MNLKMILSRDPKDHAVMTAELDKLTARLKEVLPTLADRREELLKEQERYLEDEAGSYFLTTDWEIDLGVYLDTGKLPSHYRDLEFYARMVFYAQILQKVTMSRYQEIEERLVAAADIQFFHLKDLAEQGDEKAREMYEELKKLRPGGDKPW